LPCPAHEMHTRKIHAYEMHAREVHVYEIHPHQIHDHQTSKFFRSGVSQRHSSISARIYLNFGLDVSGGTDGLRLLSCA